MRHKRAVQCPTARVESVRSVTARRRQPGRVGPGPFAKGELSGKRGIKRRHGEMGVDKPAEMGISALRRTSNGLEMESGCKNGLAGSTVSSVVGGVPYAVQCIASTTYGAFCFFFGSFEESEREGGKEMEAASETSCVGLGTPRMEGLARPGQRQTATANSTLNVDTCRFFLSRIHLFQRRSFSYLA